MPLYQFLHVIKSHVTDGHSHSVTAVLYYHYININNHNEEDILQHHVLPHSRAWTCYRQERILFCSTKTILAGHRSDCHNHLNWNHYNYSTMQQKLHN